MIVSSATAVLPVCLSPMISRRWPRPMAVIASIAVMPVYSGSFTGCRETTLGACSSSGRSASAVIVPLSSIGRPSASTTRPRNPSPTVTERIRPVCLTGSPSSIVAASPKMMQPISASSRLNATPSSPPGNSSSSLAIVRGRPATRAMPSPVSMTRPTSSRSTEGFQLSTFFRRAAAMVWGSMRSDAMGQLPSASLASSRRLDTEPSKTRSSTRATTPPITVGSITTLASMVRPVALDNACCRRSRCLSVRGTALRISATACSRVLAASRTTASAIFDRSRARPDSITNEISVTVVLFARGPRTSRTSACRLSTGSVSSVSACRSSGFCSAALANANSSSSPLARSPSTSATATSAVAYAPALSPLPKMRSNSSIRLLVRALLAGGDLGDVVVDQPLVCLLVERLADDAAGELHGDLADLRPQLVEDAVTLGADLFLRPLDGVLRLLLGVGLDITAQLLGCDAGLLDDPVALVPRVRELRPVIGELLLGLPAGVFGALELALDLLAPLLEQPVDAREHPLPEEEEQDQERDRSGDQLRRFGVQVGLLAGRRGFLGEDRKASDEHDGPSLR